MICGTCCREEVLLILVLMEDELSHLWGKFTLTEVEQYGLVAVEEEVEWITVQGNNCLVGKLISKCLIGKDLIRKTLIRGWRLSESLSFKVVGENMFLMEFEDEWGKLRVLEGKS